MLCAKPGVKRLLLSAESSEGTLYSVPSFGGHTAISHDVTIYPFLVMARTVYQWSLVIVVNFSVFTSLVDLSCIKLYQIVSIFPVNMTHLD